MKAAKDNKPMIWDSRSKTPFATYREKMFNWADALHPLGVPIMEAQERNKDKITWEYVKSGRGGFRTEFEELGEAAFRKFERILYRVITSTVEGGAAAYAKHKDRMGLMSWLRMTQHWKVDYHLLVSALITFCQLNDPVKN